MKKLLTLFFYIASISQTQALQISEVMSNPTGDDSGREWIEIYNNSSSTMDLSTITLSIKGGTAVAVSSVSGGTALATNEYAIIGSTVAGATKFLQDYPSYSGILLKSSISLVNTGVTSIDVKFNGVTVDSLASYTAAKEGSTLSLVGGSFVVSNPTPGANNQTASQDTSSNSQGTQTVTSSTTETQATIAQSSPPTADIVLYLPQHKTVVAGAEAIFSVGGMTRAGNPIDRLVYTWAYGDGGQGVGSSTLYRYAYPGKYVAQVEGGNTYIIGTGKMGVYVVSPDIEIKAIDSGKYGTFVDISNPNSYDLDFSQWQLSIDGKRYFFPKNTLLAGNTTTHISGLAMGFASTTILQGTLVKILFPNQEEIARYVVPKDNSRNTRVDLGNTSLEKEQKTATTSEIVIKKITSLKTRNQGQVLGISVVTKSNTATSSNILVYGEKNKDTRLVSFFKTLFSKH